MAEFVYKGLNLQGVVVKGEYRCDDLQQLDAWLVTKDIDLIGAWQRPNWAVKRRRVDPSSFVLFTSQLSQLLKAGVPLLECLGDLTETQDNPEFAKVVDQLHSFVETGQALSLALENLNLILPPLAIPLIRVGEKSGNLAESLAELCAALKWQKTLGERWKKAVFYPLFSGTILLLVCTFLMTFLVPSLVSFIKSTSYALPWYTELLIQVSGHIKTYGLYYVVGIIVLGVVCSLIYRWNVNARFVVSSVVLKLIWVGPVLLRIKIARFTYFSGLLYKSGVPIIVAFETSCRILDSLKLEKDLESIIESIASGEGIGQTFQTAGVFPVFISRMLHTGEKTGRIDESLILISDYYREEAEKAISRLEQMLGPTLILIVGSLLVWIIIAVIGPIYEVVLSLGQG